MTYISLQRLPRAAKSGSCLVNKRGVCPHSLPWKLGHVAGCKISLSKVPNTTTRAHAGCLQRLSAISQHASQVAAPTARAKQPAQRLLRQLAVLVVVLVISASLWQTPAVAATAARQSQSWLQGLVSFVLHLDVHLGEIIATHGRATYAILFAIVFCETGLVLTPFLPGDSLLFACGTFAAKGTLNLGALLAVFITSAILGDAVNYAAGNYFGAKALKTKLLKREYIAKTEQFYQKYGGKAVVLSRFVPIIRTFAPFVAGVGSMQYSQFAMYNVAGALIWSVLFTGAGYLFGGLAFVQHNFTLVVLAIVAVSVVPVVFEVLQARKEGNEQDSGNPTVWDNAGSAA